MPLDPSIPLNAMGANPQQPQQQMSNALQVFQMKDAMQQRNQAQQAQQNERRTAKKLDALTNRGTGLFLKYRSLIDDGKLTHNAAQAAMQEDFKREIGGLASERDDNGMPLFTQEELQGLGQEFNAGELGMILPKLMGAKNALDAHFKSRDDSRQAATAAETARHNRAVESAASRKSGGRPVPVADPKSSTGFTYQTPEGAVGQPAPAPRAQTSGKYSPKELQAARDKLRLIGVAKQQLQTLKNARDKVKDSFSSGPGGGLLPTETGSNFDGAVDTLRSSIEGITRTPGIGAQSDFEARLNQAKLPSRGEYESTRDQKIKSLDDMINALEAGYSDLLSDGQQPAAGAGASEQDILDAADAIINGEP